MMQLQWVMRGIVISMVTSLVAVAYWQSNKIEALQTAGAKTEQAAIDAATAATLAKSQMEKRNEDKIIQADADARAALDRYAMPGAAIRGAAAGLRDPSAGRNRTSNLPNPASAAPGSGATTDAPAVAGSVGCNRADAESVELRGAAADLADLLADTHRAAVAYGARTGQLEAAWPQQGDAP